MDYASMPNELEWTQDIGEAVIYRPNRQRCLRPPTIRLYGDRRSLQHGCVGKVAANTTVVKYSSRCGEGNHSEWSSRINPG